MMTALPGIFTPRAAAPWLALALATTTILCSITAASSFEAAEQSKPNLDAHQYFRDVNSVSPGRKQATDRHLGGAARYVDVAVMAPVHPARHKTPVLLGGPNEKALAAEIQDLTDELRSAQDQIKNLESRLGTVEQRLGDSFQPVSPFNTIERRLDDIEDDLKRR